MNKSNICDAQMSLFNTMLEFVRAAVLERNPVIPRGVTIDWDKLMDLSSEQGLLAWVWDGVSKLPLEEQPPRQQRINWGLSVQEITDAYEHQKSVLKEIVKICEQNNIRVLLLKGICLSEMYPKPELRPSCDIDIYLFDDCTRGARILSHDSCMLSDKHYVFKKEEVLVECHKDLIDAGTDLQNRANGFLLSTLGDSVLTENGYYVLSPWGKVVHTLLHIIAHLFNPGPDPLKIRSVLDFAMMLRQMDSPSSVEEYHRIIGSLGLERLSDLFVELSEKLLLEDFSSLYADRNTVAGDSTKIIEFWLDSRLVHPDYDNYSFLKQLFQRINYYQISKWKYDYMDEIRKRRIKVWLKFQGHFFLKSLLGFPFDKPFMESFKNSRLGKLKR